MQQQAEGVVMLCLQAQQVAGLPDAAEGRRIQLSTTCSGPAPAAAAVCRAGVADFHRQVLLLHCAPINSIDAVAVTVTMGDARHQQHTAAAGARIIASTVNLDLAEHLRRRPCPSPSVLSFVLGVGGTTTAATAAAGAVLSLTLHHRLLVTTTGTGTGTGCSSLLRSCLGLPLAAGCCPPVLRTATKPQNRQHQGPPEAAADSSSSSSGFITIEKGTISRRRPPSDHLLTTDDDEVDGKRPPGPPTTTTTCCWSLSSLDLDHDTKVENDFLAMLMLQDDDDDDDDLVDQQLDALIKDAEAETSLPYVQAADDRRRGSSIS